VTHFPSRTILSLVSASLVFAQSPPAIKDTPHTAPTYAAETSSTNHPALAQKESDLRNLLAQQPNSADLLYSLALVLRQEGNPRASLDTYTQAARLRTPDPAQLRSVALDYVLLHDYEDAIRWLERAVKMDPDNVDALYSLGRCYYTKDRYVDAGKMFQRVLALQPAHTKAQENLGLAYDATNQPDKAEEALRKAVNLAGPDSKDEWPFLDLGGFLLDRGRAPEALDLLRTAARIRPDCAACHQKLGRALLLTHDLPGSIAELETATRLDPKDPKAHYELGRALRQVGQTERAQQEFAASQKLYATHSEQ
jgi:tetratricopeptide (TPR) repeat protein